MALDDVRTLLKEERIWALTQFQKFTNAFVECIIKDSHPSPSAVIDITNTCPTPPF